jgi:16S rRNA G966 N2-methylase RsmD
MELMKPGESQLPASLEDLATFVLVGREKLTAVRAGIRAIEKLGLAKDVREQKKGEAQMLAEALLDAEVRIGEILERMPKAQGARTELSNSAVTKFETKEAAAQELGFGKMQVSRFETLARNKDLVEQVKQEARENDDLPTRTAVLQAVKYEKLKQAQEQKRADEVAEVKNAPVIFVTPCQEFLPTIEDASIDLVVTDPPYYTEFNDPGKFTAFIETWLPDLLGKLKHTGRAFICAGAYPEEISAYSRLLLECARARNLIIDAPLVWTYRNTLGQTPKMKYNLNYQLIWHVYAPSSNLLDTSITGEMFSVQDIPAPDGRHGNRYHTWQKPDELAVRLIRHASKPGDSVLDCFACTGTFLLAASKAGRYAIGCEKDFNNAKIAEGRGCKIGR